MQFVLQFAFLGVLGIAAIGGWFCLILAPFSLSDTARKELPDRFLILPRRFAIYDSFNLFRAKYYRPDRQWVRTGVIVFGVCVFGGLLLMFLLTLFDVGPFHLPHPSELPHPDRST